MENEDTHFFACGLLMFPSVWERLVGRRYRCASARIHGFCRRTAAGSDNPVLIGGCLSESVSGTLYFAIDSEDLLRIDGFEGRTARPRRTACTLTGGGLVPALVYVLRERHRHLLSEEKWSPQRFLRRRRVEGFLEPTAGEADFLCRGTVGFGDGAAATRTDPTDSDRESDDA